MPASDRAGLRLFFNDLYRPSDACIGPRYIGISPSRKAVGGLVPLTSDGSLEIDAQKKFSLFPALVTNVFLALVMFRVLALHGHAWVCMHAHSIRTSGEHGVWMGHKPLEDWLICINDYIFIGKAFMTTFGVRVGPRLTITKIYELEQGKCDLKFDLMNYHGYIRFMPYRPDGYDYVYAYIYMIEHMDGVATEVRIWANRKAVAVCYNAPSKWRNGANDGFDYYIYFDKDTFRPVAKFQNGNHGHFCVGETMLYEIQPAPWMQRLRDDPPFDFCHYIEEFKLCLEAITRLELLVRGPDWRMARVGMSI